MAFFDVSKNWVILVPPRSPLAKKAAEELSRCIGLLRGENGRAPELADASGQSAETSPVIVLNNGSSPEEVPPPETEAIPLRKGFSWRAGPARIEIYGESEQGLRNGIYDFLSALDISLPRPYFSNSDSSPPEQNEILPPLQSSGVYPLKNANIHEPQSAELRPRGAAYASLKRFVIPEKSPLLSSQKKLESFAAWASWNKFDAVVFPFGGLAAAEKNKAGELLAPYGLSLEAGGWALSLLVPQKLFLFHRELFRMEGGKRYKHINFCPTNPQTIEIIKTEGKKLFLKSPGINVFNLWPDQGKEKTWCSCPSCRAFSLVEQNCIAVNAAADALMEVRKDAFISLYETSGEEGSILLRPNVFKVEPQLVFN